MQPHSDQTATVRADHHVLAVARSVPAASRLLDVVQLFGGDPRVDVTFTVNRGSISGVGVEGMLHDAGHTDILDWDAAVADRERYHLAVAASPKEGLHRLSLASAPGGRPGHGPPLVLLPHGIGHNRLVNDSPGELRHASGLDPEQLLHGGQPIPTRVALSHPEQLERLRGTCSDVAGAVTGDPSHDRMLAHLGRRDRYRERLGAGRDRRLIVVSSTWNRDSLLGTQRETIRALLAALPADDHRIVLVAHPNVWYRHGPAQLELWFDDEIEAGLALVPPHEGWRAALIAADLVIGDHGSTTYYAAAIGCPVLLAAFGHDELDPASPLHVFGAVTPRLHLDRPILPQVTAALAAGGPPPGTAGLMIDRPGESAHRLRALLYDLLDLAPLSRPARFHPLPDPTLAASHVTAWRVTTEIRPGPAGAPPLVRVRRFPAATAAPEAGALVVDVEDTAPARRDSADAVCCGRATPAEDAARWARETLARLPLCSVAVAATEDGAFLVAADGGAWTLTRIGGSGRPDAGTVAAAAHAWLESGRSPDAWHHGVRLRAGSAEALFRVPPLPFSAVPQGNTRPSAPA